MKNLGEDRWSLNDDDREQWISNDEGWYHQQRRSGLGMRAFIRANRAELDAYIKTELNRPPAPSYRF
jgi:hypothetical protein